MDNHVSSCASEKNRIHEIDLKLKNATAAILNGVTYPELMDEIASLRQERASLETKIARASSQATKITKEDIMREFDQQINTNQVDYRLLIQKYVISLKVNERQITLSLGVAFRESSGNWI